MRSLLDSPQLVGNLGPELLDLTPRLVRREDTVGRRLACPTRSHLEGARIEDRPAELEGPPRHLQTIHQHRGHSHNLTGTKGHHIPPPRHSAADHPFHRNGHSPR